MISDFASFIELFSAIYLTISLDDLLLRRFWTPDYAKKLRNGLESISMPDIAKRPTVNAAAESYVKEEKRSRRRGTLMFSLTVLLLIVIGYENTISQIGQVGQAGIYSTLFLLTLVIYVFDEVFMKTWWRVLLSAGFLSLFVYVVYHILPNIDAIKPYINGNCPVMASFAKAFLVFTLVFPVFWQLLRNRIYTHYYLSYILSEVSDRAKDYNDALAFDTRKGHKMSSVAKPYLDVTGQAISSGDGDRPIKPYLDVLQTELSSIVYIPSLLPLIKYSYKTYKRSHYSKRQLDKYYKLYKSRSPLPKMEKFCVEEGINFKALHDYHLHKIK